MQLFSYDEFRFVNELILFPVVYRLGVQGKASSFELGGPSQHLCFK